MNEPNGRLLVVDDIEENRDLLQRRLGRQGYEVSVADSGPSALNAIAISGQGGGFFPPAES